MSDETTPTDDGKTAPPAPTPAEAQKPDSGKGEHMIPKSRLDEEIAKNKAAQTQLDTLAKKESDREEAAKLARGEHEEVIADLKPKAEQAEHYADEIAGMLAHEIEQIPEDKRDLVPEGDPLTILKWVRKANTAGIFALPKPPETDAGALGDKTDKHIELTPEEKRLVASIPDFSEEDYAKQKSLLGDDI